MTPQPLPATLDARRWVDQQREARGALSVSDMPRLAGLVAEGPGAVEVRLRFHKDSGGRDMISGQLDVSLSLICQRCLARFDWQRTLQVRVGLVDAESEAHLVPADREPCALDDGLLRLHAFIEDEVILGLPVVARHENDPLCRPEGDRTDPELTRPNPFAVLESLKRRDD